jgi:hypothetical protein
MLSEAFSLGAGITFTDVALDIVATGVNATAEVNAAT